MTADEYLSNALKTLSESFVFVRLTDQERERYPFGQRSAGADRHIVLSSYYGNVTCENKRFKNFTNTLHKLYPNLSGEAITRTLEALARTMLDRLPGEQYTNEPIVLFSLLTEMDLLNVLKGTLESFSDLVLPKTLFVPIAGLSMEIEHFSIGPVMFCRTSDTGLIEDIQENATRAFKDDARSLYQPFEAQSCHARINFEADSQYALSEGTGLIERAIHVLNFFFVSCRHRYRRKSHISPSQAKISIRNDPNGRLETHLLQVHKSNNDQDGYVYTASMSRAPFYPYQIAENRPEFQSMTKYLPQLSKAFFPGDRDKKKSPTIDDRIRQAVTWFSKAVQSDTYEEQYLALAIGFETLLGHVQSESVNAHWGSITQTLAERAAFLLGKTFEERVTIEKEVKDLYKTRSKIVHTGAVTDISNVIRLEAYLENSVLAILDKGFDSLDDMEAYFKRMRLS